MVTSTFTLKLIFYGLAGIVPKSDGSALSMLLVDTQGFHYSSDGCDLHEHFPVLHVAAEKCTVESIPPVRSAAKDVTPGAVVADAPPVKCPLAPLSLPKAIRTPIDDLGVTGSWLLRGKLLTIEGLPSRAGGSGNGFITGRRRSGASLPGNSFEATDFSWVPKVSLGEETEASCFTPSLGSHCPISTRAVVGNATFQTCHLIEIVGSSGVNNYICSYEFRPLTIANPREAGVQAVADAVMATATLPRSQKVVLTVQDLDPTQGGNGERIVLDAGSRDTVEVWILNEVIPTPIHDNCNTKSVDRHFELYYDLSERRNGRPFPLASRPVPQVTDDCIKAKDIQPECPVLIYKPPFGGPVPGDKPACGTRLFAPNPQAGFPSDVRR